MAINNQILLTFIQVAFFHICTKYIQNKWKYCFLLNWMHGIWWRTSIIFCHIKITIKLQNLYTWIRKTSEC